MDVRQAGGRGADEQLHGTLGAVGRPLAPLGGLFALVWGCGGLFAESPKCSALYTLSLPVTRKQLLRARTFTGLAQLIAIAMIPPFAISILAPTIGQHTEDVLKQLLGYDDAKVAAIRESGAIG